MSRELTAAEVREAILFHFAHMARYWAETPLTRPEFQRSIEAAGGETAYRLEGLVHSLLVALDGGVMGLPAFNLSPAPHPDDKAYHQQAGEDWWPAGVVINDCQLHELIRWIRPIAKQPINELGQTEQ